MDMFLLVVTVISLVIALVMSVAAWRMARVERSRSAARVAALAAAASATMSDGDFPSEQAEPRLARRVEPVVTRAAAVSRGPVETREPAVTTREAVAVSAARPTAPWAPARVSLFPLDGQDVRASDTPDRMRDVPVVSVSRTSAAHATMSDGFLGSSVTAPPSGGRQRGLAIAACVLFVAIVTGGYFTIFGGQAHGVSAAASANGASAPLELVSLRHERQGSRLSITGLVRNPVKGGTTEHLAAVVFLFDQRSAFLTSARADIDVTKLTPGDESPFVIALDAPSNVARYRVSFRTDGGVVPHVDRRGQEPIARELP